MIFQSPNEIPALEKIGEWSREGSVSVFGADFSGERKPAAIGFDYVRSTAAESTASQIRFVSAESAARN